MGGVLFLSLLFNASIAFASHPELTRFRWIDKASTAKALRRILRSSMYIRNETNGLSDDDLFKWVKANDARQRYGFIRAVRLNNLKNVSPELLKNNLNLSFVDFNSQMSQEVTEEHPHAEGTEETKSNEHFDKFLDHFFPEHKTDQPDEARDLEEDIASVEPKEEDTEENPDLPADEADWDETHVAPAVVPVAPPPILTPVTTPGPRPSVGAELAQARYRIGNNGAVKGFGQVSKNAFSWGQITFVRQIVDPVSNFISSHWLNGSESPKIPMSMMRLGANAMARRGVQAAGARAAAMLAAKAAVGIIPGGAEAMVGVEVAKKSFKYIWWLLVATVVFLIFFLSLFIKVQNTTPPLVMKAASPLGETGDEGPGGGGGGGAGGSCPSQSEIDANKNIATCKYLNPSIDIFDTNISPEAIETYVNKYAGVFTAAELGSRVDFLQRVSYIVSQSKKVGLNPVIFLGYWKSESLFSTSKKTTADLGCAPGQGRKAFEVEVDCAVGLTPEGGSLTSRCASPTNPNKSGCTTPIKTFDQFAEGYGSKSVDPSNCSSTYNVLLEVASELKACTAGGALQACEGGWPTTGTITQGPKGLPDHAGIYSSSGGGRQALDLANNSGEPIYATFNGQVRAVTDGCIQGDTTCGGGFGNNVVLGAKASNGTNFDIVYAHLGQGSTLVKDGQTINSGTKLGLMGSTGLSYGAHLHYELKGVSAASPYIPQNLKDLACDSPDGKSSSTNNPCSPLKITYSATECTASQDQKAASVPGSGYWFKLIRNGTESTETLYEGPYGDASKSTPVEGFTGMKVNPGAEGKTPTPLPQKYFASQGSDRDYWLVTHMRNTTAAETNPNGNFHMGDHFIILDVAGGYTGPYYGPVPYTECPTSPQGQCNWVYAGQFGLHGVSDRQLADNTAKYLDTGGSAGCIRHNDDVVNKLYDFFESKGYPISQNDNAPFPAKFAQDQIRYYIQDGGT